jgi:hypothetical protein
MENWFGFVLFALLLSCLKVGAILVPLAFIIVGVLSLRERVHLLKSGKASADEPADNYSFVLIMIGVLSLGCVIFGLWSTSW